ncbi:MAG: hypothetical protein AVO35_10140 [Candidatus Aegiribacteria sp. MLS_C]|nr:MAG: hypothetical protein AVO35_10140 [Candidatus Aegiribacteria sp. MLS_C]
MSLVDDWREKHPTRSSRGRVMFYIFLLVMVIVFMLKADSLVRGFTSIFFPTETECTEAGED